MYISHLVHVISTLIFRIFLFGSLPLIFTGCGNEPKSTSQSTETTTNQVMPADSVRSTNMFNDKDNDFLNEAISGGLMEVELGQYASEHAVNPRVKSFGEMMVKDHTAANQEMKTLAAGKNNAVLDTMAEKKKMTMISDLKKEKGVKFDKKYISSMVDDHEKDTDKFRNYAQNGDNAELKAFAAKTLPILEMHLDSAKKINDAIK